MPEFPNSRSDGRVAFTHPDFLLYELARFLIIAATEMQSVAVGWAGLRDHENVRWISDWVGLAQFLPGVLLFAWYQDKRRTGSTGARF